MKTVSGGLPDERRLAERVHELTAALAQARAALQKGELQMAGIVNSAMDAVVSVDGAQKVVLFNAAAEKMFLCPATKALGQPLALFIPPRFREDHQRQVEDFAKSGTTTRRARSLGLLAGVRADGEEFPAEVSISHFALDGQEFYTAIVRDVSERRRAEEALAKERTLLRTLFDLLPQDIYVKDVQGRYIAGNAAFARRMGVGTPAELLGKTDADFLPAAVAAAVRAEEKAVLAGEAMIDHEGANVGRTGAPEISWTSKLPLKDEQGRIIGLVGKRRDITEVKRAENELRLFRALVDQSSDVFEVIDPESARFLDVNARGCEILGYSRAEYLALRLFEIDPSRAEASWPQFVAGVRKAGSVSGEGVHRRKDGTTFPVEFSVKWVRLDRDYLVTMARDITARKRLEEQFLRVQRLEAIGTLASGIAHDLNNILAPMLMAAALLKGKLTAQHDRDILSMVESSAQRGANIIGQLLTFSRGIEGARVEVQAKHLLKEMANIMRETFPRNIEIVQAIPGDLWTVVADATQMHQVLLNLCVNARDSMPAGGKLTVAGANVHVDEAEAMLRSLSKPGPYLVLSVTDTGHGIPPAVLARIFDPFFTTKEVGKGSGLGLSTVLGIAKSHGGNVTVYSEPGHGAVFNVYLPATGGTSGPAATESVAPMPVGHGELILVVDDEAPIRETTGRVLRQYGYRVLAAATGEEAIKLFIEHINEVAVVLTDVMMPGMGGLELVRSLRILLPDVRIVATSGLEGDDKRKDFGELGVGKFLPKPCKPKAILQAIQLALATTG